MSVGTKAEKRVFGLPAASRRPVRGWYVALLLPMLVWMAHQALVAPPSLAELVVHEATLAQPLEFVWPSGRGHGGPYVIVTLDDGTYRIDNICMPFAWDCALTPSLAALKHGDRLRVWSHDQRIWQLAREDDNEPRVAYVTIARAYNRNRFWIGIMIFVVAAVFWWRWRTSRAQT